MLSTSDRPVKSKWCYHLTLKNIFIMYLMVSGILLLLQKQMFQFDYKVFNKFCRMHKLFCSSKNIHIITALYCPRFSLFLL